MTFCIQGAGYAVPTNLITQDDAARLAIELAGPSCANPTAIQSLYIKTGVRKRHSTVITCSTNGRPATQSFFPVALDDNYRGPTTRTRMDRYEAAALQLATRAAESALAESRTAPLDITQLVTVSCTGFAAPGVDIGLVERLSLNRSVSRTHIGFMGCHGALNGLRIAAALSQATTGTVLLCCVELCSLHHQYAADAQQTVANALFSDGAAAIVGACAQQPSGSTRWRIASHFSCLLPNSVDLMSWRIGDNGFEMQLSSQVPSVIRQALRPWLSAQLAAHHLSIADIRGWAIHPGGPKILSACAEALGLEPHCIQASQRVLEEYGNMSSPTVLFVIDELCQRGDWLPCVALAFGPGLSIEAALLV